MLIDWFTVGAQIVNFFILIYLLKRFLYKPVLKAMDERERKIADNLQQAERSRRKAKSDAEAVAAKRREVEMYKEQLLQQAKKEIQEWREQALAKGRDEFEKKRISWQEHLDKEKEEFLQNIKETLCRQVFNVAAKAIGDLADEQLEEKMIARFSSLLPQAFATDGNEKSKPQTIRIVSGFAINKEQQQEIRSVLDDIFPKVAPKFEVNTELGFGVMLSAGPAKFEWNIRRYMDEMEQQVMQAMQPAVQSGQ